MWMFRARATGSALKRSRNGEPLPGKALKSAAIFSFTLATAIAVSAGLCATSMAQEVDTQARKPNVSLSNGVDGSVRVKTVSYRDIPFRTVVRQEFDFSCGSAAVATLLTYHFERPTTEQDVFKAMYEMGDKAKINRQGFSLFEMKQYLESVGYRADGFRVPLDKVARIGIPVIVLIEWQNYKHFVVIKGVRDGHVLIGDPARGLKIMSESDFMSYWKDGIVFAIHNADDVGKRHFNNEDEWKGRPKSPMSAAFSNDSLRVYNLAIPGGGSVGIF